jgi:sugar phosphate isomerase/epimerase
MAKTLLFGIQTNGIRHTEADGMPDIDSRFAMVREAKVFDYVDKTPDPHEIEEFRAASQKYSLPVLGSGWFYRLGQDEDLLARNLEVAGSLGSRVHNVQILAHHADGHLVSDAQVVDFYERAVELGAKQGVTPCLEVHVNMWSEDFRRVSPVGRLAEARGLPFRMTLDHSHVIFKMDNPKEQEVLDIRGDVEAGRLVLDPFKDGDVCSEWIGQNWVGHCHARAAIPNNPLNLDAHDEDGNPGRGIQYPFIEPKPGTYHAAWRAEALEPWKQVVRGLLAHHASDEASPLGQISTEFIPNLDYGQGCRYSLFEQAIACVEWMRAEWARAQAAAA